MQINKLQSEVDALKKENEDLREKLHQQRKEMAMTSSINLSSHSQPVLRTILRTNSTTLKSLEVIGNKRPISIGPLSPSIFNNYKNNDIDNSVSPIVTSGIESPLATKSMSGLGLVPLRQPSMTSIRDISASDFGNSIIDVNEKSMTRNTTVYSTINSQKTIEANIPEIVINQVDEKISLTVTRESIPPPPPAPNMPPIAPPLLIKSESQIKIFPKIGGGELFRRKNVNTIFELDENDIVLFTDYDFQDLDKYFEKVRIKRRRSSKKRGQELSKSQNTIDEDFSFMKYERQVVLEIVLTQIEKSKLNPLTRKEILKAIEDYNIQLLDGERIKQLLTCAVFKKGTKTDENVESQEMKNYKAFMNRLNKLSQLEKDKLLSKLSKIDGQTGSSNKESVNKFIYDLYNIKAGSPESQYKNIRDKLNIMDWMVNFDESANNLYAGLLNLNNATRAVRNSKKLAFVLKFAYKAEGYMADSKAVSGLRLEKLAEYTNTKMNETNEFKGNGNLWTFIVKEINKKYPEKSKFYDELLKVGFSQNAQMPFENLEQVEREKQLMNDAEKIVSEEFRITGHEKLGKFLKHIQKRIIDLERQSKKATDSYHSLVAYFGETVENMPPEVFFPKLTKFIEDYKSAEKRVEEIKFDITK